MRTRYSEDQQAVAEAFAELFARESATEAVRAAEAGCGFDPALWLSGRTERWPVHAENAAENAIELRATLTDHGHLLALPTEPAALANLLEIELRTHLEAAILRTDGAEMRVGTQRSFPGASRLRSQ